MCVCVHAQGLFFFMPCNLVVVFHTQGMWLVSGFPADEPLCCVIQEWSPYHWQFFPVLRTVLQLEEIAASVVQGEAERAEIFICEKAGEDFSDVCKPPTGRSGMGSDSAWWCAVEGQESTAQTEIQEIPFKHRTLLLWAWGNAGAGCLIFGHAQNLTGRNPEQRAVVPPALGRGVGLGDLQRSLPTSSMLWFQLCNMPCILLHIFNVGGKISPSCF